MDRLSAEMKKRQLVINGANPDAALLLGFRPIPKHCENIKKVFRFDGIWNYRFFSDRAPFKSINKYIFNRLNNKNAQNHFIADAIIYQSEYSKKCYDRYFDRKQADLPYKIIFNGIDTDIFRPKKNQKYDSKIQILMSHTYWPSKRFLFSTEVAKELKRRNVNFRINILGKGIVNPIYRHDTMAHFKRQIHRNNLAEYFHFIGFIEPDKLHHVYHNYDIFLSFSHIDPCPNVVVEAMASGLPIVAPRSGGIPEQLGINYDYLVEEGIDDCALENIWAYSRPLDSTVKNFTDKILLAIEQKKVISDYLRERAVNEFKISDTSSKYLDFIEQIL